jgi:F-type H+-transporting ATPase subunit alpha
VDDIPVNEVCRFEAELIKYIDGEQKALRLDIATKKALDADLTARLKAAIGEFKAKRFIPRATA